MKLLKLHYKLLFFVCSIALILSVSLLFFYMPLVVFAYHLYMVWIMGALILVFSPLGSKRLITTNHDFPPLKPTPWIFQILILELSLFAVFWGICQLSGTALPVLIDSHSISFTDTIAHTFIPLPLGLFPWLGAALIACVMGYRGFCQNRHSTLSALFNPKTHAPPENTFNLIVNTSARAAMMFALSSTIALLTLLFATTVAPTYMHSLRGATMGSLLFFCLLIFLTTNRFIKRQIHLLITRYHLSPSIVLLILLAAFSIVVLILSLFFGKDFMVSFKMPYFIHVLSDYGTLVNWKLFSILWWLAWMPVIGIFIAHLSRGYSLRSVVLVSCALPFAFYLLSFFIHSNDHATSNWIVMLVSFLGYTGLLSIIAPRSTFAWLMQINIPKGGIIKHRHSDKFIFKIGQFSALMLMIYLIGGVVLLNVVFFSSLLMLSVLLIGLPLSLILCAR